MPLRLQRLDSEGLGHSGVMFVELRYFVQGVSQV